MKNNNDYNSELCQISNLIKDIDVKINYSSPSGYFENFPDIIKEKIKQSKISEDRFDTKEIFLNFKPNSKMFSVPENYFTAFPEIILDKVHSQKKKSVSLIKKRLYRYSAAAIAISLLGTILFYNMPRKSESINPTQTDVVMNEAKQIILNKHLEAELDKVNEMDAVEYLMDNGHDINAALIASLSENISLPEEVDYLYDTETLNNCLSKLK